MRTPSWAALAVVVTGLSLVGCQARSESRGAGPSATEVGQVSLKTTPGPQPEGRFYAVIRSGGPNDDQLYELRFSPPKVRVASPTKRVSSVGACQERVFVAAAQEEVGFTDHLQELRGERLVALDGLGPVPALSPAVSRDCRVAYTFVDRSGPELVSELRVWDPAQRVGKALYRTHPGDGLLLGTAWGPDGQVAALRLPPDRADSPTGNPSDGRPAMIVVVRADGSTSEVNPGTPDPVGLAWGRNTVAVGDGEAKTILIEPETGKRMTIEGWRPLVWSPKEDVLLLKDSATGQSLGLLDAKGPSSVKEVGRLTGSVFDVDWLPE